MNEKKKVPFKVACKNASHKMSDIFVKFGSKIGSNKLLAAIRDAFAVASVPMLGAAFPLIIGMIFFQNGVAFGNIPGIKDGTFIMWTDKYIAQWFWAVWSAATVPFTLYFVISIGYFISKAYLKNGSALTGAIVTVACFFALMPFGKDYNEGPKYIGTAGILLGVVAGLLAPFIFAKLMSVKRFRFKLPESVPPMIAEVFASVISITIMLTGFMFIGKGWTWIWDKTQMTDLKGNAVDTIFKAFEYGLGVPFQKLGVNVGTTGVIIFFTALFWFFGLHGSNILSPITGILWTPLVTNNVEYWNQYLASAANTGIGPGGNYWTLPLEVFGQIQYGLFPVYSTTLGNFGGTGSTFGLIIAILIFSKYRPYREVSKLAFGPGIFGINEPIIFGIPIIYNITYFIPFVLGWTIVSVLAHLFVTWHWLRPVVVSLGWMPHFIGNILSTGMDYRAIIFDLINAVLVWGMWQLFLPLGEKVQKSIDAQNLGITLNEYEFKLISDEKVLRKELQNDKSEELIGFDPEIRKAKLEKLSMKSPNSAHAQEQKWAARDQKGKIKLAKLEVKWATMEAKYDIKENKRMEKLKTKI